MAFIFIATLITRHRISFDRENYQKPIQGKSEAFDSYDRPNNFKLDSNRRFLQPVWPWKVMDDLEKLNGTFPILHEALCIIWNPSVNLNLNLTTETLNSGRNRQLLSRVTLRFDVWLWKTIWHLFYTPSSFVHHFKAMGKFKLQLQSANSQFGSKSAISCPVWPWNLKNDLEIQKGTSSMLHQALGIISNRWVKSNLSYSTKTLNSGHNCWFLVPRDLEI